MALAYGLLIIAGSGCTTISTDPPRIEAVAFEQDRAETSASYDLVSVDGAAIPASVFEGNSTFRIHSGVFVIRADGSCSAKTVFGPVKGGEITRIAHATCTRKDSVLTMQWRGAGVTRGILEGETFTMDNHGMTFAYKRSARTADRVKYSGIGECGSENAAAATVQTPAGVIDDFDSGLPTGRDGDGRPIGFFTFQDSDRSSVAAFTTASHPRRPGAGGDNKVLQLNLNVDAWAGVVHSFENETVDTWMPRDWRGFNAFSFWIYGNNNGNSLYVEILDNRKPCPESGAAELYTHVFTDNFSGWRLITVPFAKLVRKEIGNDAPNDGLGLSAVHGWAFGALNTDGPVTYYIDDFGVR